MAGSLLVSKAQKQHPLHKEPDSGGMWKHVWRRLVHRPEAVFGMIVIALFVLVAILTPWIAPYSMTTINLESDNLPPAWVEKSKIGYSGDPRFLLGTDRMGRDLLSWAIYGTRTSMLLGFLSAPIVAVFGTLVGLIAGYTGGRVDNVIMRITDIFYAFPPIMVFILAVILLRDTVLAQWWNGIFMFIIAFLLVTWVGAARMVRSTVLGVKNLEYIEAAHCLGVPTWRIIFRHILPNCIGPLLIWATLVVPQLILTEAILGYLGIRTGPSSYSERWFDQSWGGMINQGRYVFHVNPVTLIIPAVCVGLISIAFTFLGDALRDAFDPENDEARARGS